VGIRPRFGAITTARQYKHGFADITSLHAVIAAPSDTELVGTDVALSGVADDDVEAAKALFRHYAGDEVLEETEYGVVLKRPKWAARQANGCHPLEPWVPRRLGRSAVVQRPRWSRIASSRSRMSGIGTTPRRAPTRTTA